MKLASITITSNREDIIGDAIDSVKDWVDIAVVVDMGITDRTLDIIKEAMGGRVSVVKADPSLPTGDVRNIGLDHAHAVGCDWAVTLDTDERIVPSGDVRAMLGSSQADILLAEAIVTTGATYHKERFFRLPTKDRFKRHIHECMVPQNSNVGLAPCVRFAELPKVGEAFEAKMHMIIDALSKDLEAQPEDGRNWFYLGDAQFGMKLYDDALKSFYNCVRYSTWPDEAAWACLRMATCYEIQGKFEDAVACCAAGLSKHAGFPELAFYAGALSLGMGRLDQAIYWCRMAVVNGDMGGEREVRPRMSWKIPYCMGRGPLEMLKDCYKAMGWPEEEAKCAKMLEQA